MTYAADEASQEGGDPIELYHFVGTNNSYFYTSGESNFDFDTPPAGGGDDTYFATSIRRSNVGPDENGTASELSVILPYNAALCSEYVFQIAPPELRLTIYRVHRTSGDYAIYWDGPVAGWNVKDREVIFRLTNDFMQRMNEKLPRASYQTFCNNVLFDSICGLARSDYREQTTISSFSSGNKVVNVASMGTRPNGWANGGDLVHDATGERRTILDHTGTALTVLWPFSAEVDVSEAVTVHAGCNHSLDHCVNKFNVNPRARAGGGFYQGNEDRFNGMRFLVSQGVSPTQVGD